MGKPEQVRQIGARLCQFANSGRPCLCHDKNRPLCSNMKALAIEVWDMAHQTEMSRQDWNKSNALTSNLDKVAAPKAKHR